MKSFSLLAFGVATAVVLAGCTTARRNSAPGRVVTVPAKPRPVEMDLQKTAIIVVDMQNDFGAKGGMLDRAGFDITPIRAAVPPIARALAAARSLKIPVIYLKMAYRPDLSDMGPKGSPNRVAHEHVGVGNKILAPNGVEGRILIRDTWNTEILDELRPVTGDVVLYKNRFSGFYKTELDAVLKKKGISHLIITGCTTSVCVESTVRDAMFRDYTPVLLADCMSEPVGYDLPRSNHDASLYLIEARFGVVSSSDEFIKAVQSLPPGHR